MPPMCLHWAQLGHSVTDNTTVFLQLVAFALTTPRNALPTRCINQGSILLQNCCFKELPIEGRKAKSDPPPPMALKIEKEGPWKLVLLWTMQTLKLTLVSCISSWPNLIVLRIAFVKV